MMFGILIVATEPDAASSKCFLPSFLDSETSSAELRPGCDIVLFFILNVICNMSFDGFSEESVLTGESG